MLQKRNQLCAETRNQLLERVFCADVQSSQALPLLLPPPPRRRPRPSVPGKFCFHAQPARGAQPRAATSGLPLVGKLRRRHLAAVTPLGKLREQLPFLQVLVTFPSRFLKGFLTLRAYVRGVPR
eukprot:scaffold61348_cov55-Phaeocystis_antarctica.AAC.3